MSTFTINVPALEKLLDYAASGIGSVAGPLLASWRARKEADALSIQAGGQADALQTITAAQVEARNALASQNVLVQSEMNFSDVVTQRIQFQEEKRQRNIEAVVKQAAEQLGEGVPPDHDPDHDWTARFFAEVQDVSSAEMQMLWARILAGEVERPGSTSIRTLIALKNLTQTDAQLFSRFCGFAWDTGWIRPFVYNTEDEIYTNNEIKYGTLIHLESLGLIKLVDIGSLRMTTLSKSLVVAYFGQRVQISFPEEEDNILDFGRCALTSVGLELFPICDAAPIDGFFQYVCDTWKSKKLELVEIIERRT